MTDYDKTQINIKLRNMNIKLSNVIVNLKNVQYDINNINSIYTNDIFENDIDIDIDIDKIYNKLINISKFDTIVKEYNNLVNENKTLQKNVNLDVNLLNENKRLINDINELISSIDEKYKNNIKDKLDTYKEIYKIKGLLKVSEATKYKKLVGDLIKIENINKFVTSFDKNKKLSDINNNIIGYENLSKDYNIYTNDTNDTIEEQFPNIHKLHYLNVQKKITEMNQQIKNIKDNKKEKENYKEMEDYYAENKKGFIQSTQADYKIKIDKYEKSLEDIITIMSENMNKYNNVVDEKTKLELLKKIKQNKKDIDKIKKDTDNIKYDSITNQYLKNKIEIVKEKINNLYNKLNNNFKGEAGEAGEVKINFDEEIKNKISESYFTNTTYNNLNIIFKDLEILRENVNYANYIELTNILKNIDIKKNNAETQYNKNDKNNKDVINLFDKISQLYDDIKKKIQNKMNKEIENVSSVDSIKQQISKILSVNNTTIEQNKISDFYVYIFYKNDNKLNAIAGTKNDNKINYKLTPINKLEDIDISIKDTISDGIKSAYKSLQKQTGGSLKKKINNRRTKKEKTRKSITKRKNKWINRKSHKYIK
jgi:hypothetical protein